MKHPHYQTILRWIAIVVILLLIVIYSVFQEFRQRLMVGDQIILDEQTFEIKEIDWMANGNKKITLSSSIDKMKVLDDFHREVMEVYEDVQAASE